jgi:protoporphyrinogen oxidase
MNNSIEDITIIGGGASGICVGYYAKKAGLKFTIFEAADAVGGNAVTIQYKDFRFDSGAHRWHDKHPDITKELKDMMGRDLKRINVPSHIFHNGKLVNFPLSPLDLLEKLGPPAFMKVGFEVLGGRILKTSKKKILRILQ